MDACSFHNRMPPLILDNVLLKKISLPIFLHNINYQIAGCTLQCVCISHQPSAIVKHLEFHKQASCTRIQNAFLAFIAKVGIENDISRFGLQISCGGNFGWKIWQIWYCEIIWNFMKQPFSVKISIAPLGTWVRSASEVTVPWVCPECAQGVPRVCPGCARGVPRVCPGCAQSMPRVCSELPKVALINDHVF